MIQIKPGEARLDWGMRMHRRLKIFWLPASLWLLTACQVTLAPAYDQTIVSGLDSANSDIQALIVAIGTGNDTSTGTASTYPARAAAYNHIVAELAATALIIQTRPLPDSNFMKQADGVLLAGNLGDKSQDPKFTDAPSLRAVNDLASVIKAMQAADENGKLYGGIMTFYESQADDYLSAAITYENFLKR